MNQTHAPSINKWNELLEPFFRVSGVALWLGVSPSAIRYRIATRQLIGLKTADRAILLPSFQFNEHGEAPKALREVLTAMDREGVDPWGDALLLREHRPELGGLSPIDALRAGQTAEVFAFANELGRELSHLIPPPFKVSP